MYLQLNASCSICIFILTFCVFATPTSEFVTSISKNYGSKLHKGNGNSDEYFVNHLLKLSKYRIYQKVNTDSVKSYPKRRNIFKNRSTRKRRTPLLPSNITNIRLEYSHNLCRLYTLPNTSQERLVYDCRSIKNWNATDSGNRTFENLQGLDTSEIDITGSTKHNLMFLVLSDVKHQWKAPETASEIRLRQLNIGIIESNAFIRVKNRLRKIDLGQNSITYVSRKAFAGLRYLEELNLSQNRIQFLPRGVFYGLLRLRALDLAHNEIEMLHPRSFKDAVGMVYFNVSYNLLNDISADLFLSFTAAQPTSVDIRQNKLTRPKSDWLTLNKRNYCAKEYVSSTEKEIEIYLNSSANSTVADQMHILNASDNPWDCKCDDALDFTETLIKTLSRYKSMEQCFDIRWEVDLPCSLSNDSATFNLGLPDVAAPILFKQCCAFTSNWTQSCPFIKTWLARNNKDYSISNEHVTIIGIIIVICIPVLLTASPDCNPSTSASDNGNVKVAAVKSAEIAYGVVSRVTHTGILSTDRYISELKKEPNVTKTRTIPGKRYYDNYSDSD